jgi:hypothetical protein
MLTQGDESVPAQQPLPIGSAALFFVIPTRISCHAALDKVACAAFRKEGRMICANAVKFHRESGGAKPRDLRFSGFVLETFVDRA